MKSIAIIGRKECLRNCNYFNAVEACGAEPFELDPDGDVKEGLRRLSESADGLIIPGGIDLCPELYNEENIACGETDPRLDNYEIEIVREAVKMRIPILGVCRGHQLLNVFFGGSLYQDISCCEKHKPFDMTKDRAHKTKVEPESFIYDIYGSEIVRVNSAHHQAIKKLGEHLIPVQYSEEGVIEAVYHDELPVYGVQWHPERMCLKNRREDTEDGLKLFQYFIDRVTLDFS